MTPLKLLARAVRELEPYAGCYAVAGGLAASIYRVRPRLTNDVNIAIDVGGIEKSKKAAEKIIESMGLTPALGWISDPDKKLKKAVAFVIARQGKDDTASTVDFLLPVFPWLESAVVRAQHNALDYGFGPVPTVTPEDLIVAKAFALSIEPNRFTDMDDIQSIFSADNQLDLPHLVSAFEKLALSLPTAIEDKAPKALLRVSKRNRRSAS